MQAARWDTTIERGFAWRRVLRRTSTGGPLVMVAPVRLEVLRRDGSVLLTVDGVISPDGHTATLDVTAEQAALAAGRYEHRLIVGDPGVAAPQLVARGYVTVNDRVGGR